MKYRDLEASVGKAKLAINLVSLLGERLAPSKVKALVDVLYPLGEIEYKMHNTPESFADAVTLRYVGVQHSWAGEDITLEEGQWLVGEGEFGCKKHLDYSNNGEVGSSQIENETPDFIVGILQIALVSTETTDNLNRRETLYSKEHVLHILLPEVRPNIPPELLKVIEKYSLA